MTPLYDDEGGRRVALDQTQQPAGGSWVALTVHSGEEGDDVIHRAYFTWRYESPLEPLEESRYLELTRDPEADVIKVPVWLFGLTLLGPDEWRLDYWSRNAVHPTVSSPDRVLPICA